MFAAVECSRKRVSSNPSQNPTLSKQPAPCFLSVSAFQHKPTPTIKPEFLRRNRPFQHRPCHQHRILLPRRDHLPRAPTGVPSSTLSLVKPHGLMVLVCGPRKNGSSSHCCKSYSVFLGSFTS